MNNSWFLTLSESIWFFQIPEPRKMVTTLFWWLMIVTNLRCWWQNHYVGDFFRSVKTHFVTNIDVTRKIFDSILIPEPMKSKTDVDFQEIVPSLGTRLNNTTMRIKDIEGTDWNWKSLAVSKKLFWLWFLAHRKNEFAKSLHKPLWRSWKLKCLTSLWSVWFFFFEEIFNLFSAWEKWNACNLSDSSRDRFKVEGI